MSRNTGIFKATLVAVAAATILLVCVFLGTHASWYDGLSHEQKVQFWNEAFVAYGTLGLAVTTFASVFETQQVLSGEDRRFRQSLMPVVRLSGFMPQFTETNVSVKNVGRGAARNIRLYISATVDWRWNDQGTADNQDKHTHRLYEAEGSFVMSYLEAGDEDGVSVEMIKTEGDVVPGMMVSSTMAPRILFARLCYQDLFGSDYETSYAVDDGVINWRKFDWTSPAHLASGL